VEKNGGKEAWQVVVSKDGTAETETFKVKNAKGQEFTIIIVSDKQ
jgi:hypothetical protein